MNTLKNTAQRAGFWYLFMGITGAFGLMYIPSHFIDAASAQETATAILQEPTLFRLGILGNLLCQVGFLILILLLYRLFRSTDKKLAQLMLGFVLAGIPIAMLNELNHMAALLLANNSLSESFSAVQNQSLMMLFLELHDNGVMIAEVFWGLWLLPLGLLSYKSGFIPKIFGIMLIIGSFGYLIEVFFHILLPEYHAVVGPIVTIPSAIAEISFLLWLLIKGVKKEAGKLTLT
jgi:hypothetical protein